MLHPNQYSLKLNKIRMLGMVTEASLRQLLRYDVLMASTASLFTAYLQIIFMAYLGIRLEFLNTMALLIGFIFGIRNFVQIFFRIPMGEFSQIVGRKPLIVGGTFMYSLSFIFMYLADHWVWVMIGTCFLAFGMSLYYPAMFAYIGDISNGNYGKINAIVFQGSDLASIVGAYIIKYLLDANILNLNGVFFVSFIFGIFATLLLFIFLPEVLSDENKVIVESKSSALADAFKRSHHNFFDLTRRSGLNTIYRFQVVIAFGEFFFQSFFGLLVVLTLGFKESDVVGIISLGTLILFVFKPILGSIIDKFGFRIPVLVTLVFNGFLLFIITQLTTYWMVAVVYSFYMAGVTLCYLGANSATSNTAASSDRGKAMGVLGVWVSIGRTSSSIILGIIWEILQRNSHNSGSSLAMVFQITGAMLILGSFLLYRVQYILKDTLDVSVTT